MAFPMPENEVRRLAVLRRYDRHADEVSDELNRICTLARALFKVPVAMITIVDAERRTVRGCSGAGMRRDVPRADTLCAHAICGEGPMIVPDARADPRFRDAPPVCGEPYIRFYAAAPLAFEPGVHLGTLCLIDHAPREMDAEAGGWLAMLSEIAVDRIRMARLNREARREIERREASEAALRQNRAALARREALLARTARLAGIGGWEYDAATGVLEWSDEMRRIHEVGTGFRPAAETVQSFYPGKTGARLASLAERALAEGAPFDSELAIVTAKGRERIVRVTGEPVAGPGGARRLVGTMQDMTGAKDAEARMAHLANYDGLTGLPNRRLFLDRLERVVAAATRSGRGAALLLLDIDDFKLINDASGHEAGDQVLVAMAERLRGAVRAADTVARLGGDEFAVVLADLDDASGAARVAREILDLLALPVELAGGRIHAGGSIGISVFPGDDRLPAQLLKNADMALGRAKALGRGRYCMFVPALKESIETRQRAVSEVREAIVRDELELVYQPKIDFSRERIAGFEGLLRWRHPGRGLLAPGAFLSAFEDQGVAGMIGETVVAQAMRDIRGFLDAGCDFGRVAINVSAVQFHNNDFAERIARALADNGVPAERLEIEVTESVFLDRGAEMVSDALRKLHRMGVVIALDDFGTGYASLTHLKQFPVDTLKIDQSFVREIGRDADDAAIVRAVVNLGHSLAMTVVAEGVETEAQRDYLRLCGCDEGQGYLFSRPVRVADVPALVAGTDEAPAEPRASAYAR